MKKLLLFLFLTYSIICYGQFAQVGSKWYYGVSNFQNLESYLTYEIIKDTIIDNETFSKIVYNDTLRSVSHIYFLMKEGDKTYYWNSYKKCLLFDLTAKKGDTLTIDANFYLWGKKKDTTISILIKIDSIASANSNLLVNTDTIRTYYYSNATNLVAPGYLKYGFYTDRFIKHTSVNDWLLSSFENITTGDNRIYVRCFKSLNYNYKNKEIGAKKCDFITLGLANINKLEAAIYPNPTFDKLFINWVLVHIDPIHIQVYNYAGQLVKQFSFASNGNFSVDVSDLPNGFYLLNIINGNLTLTSKFLKQ